jgi:hypothetical protein
LLVVAFVLQAFPGLQFTARAAESAPAASTPEQKAPETVKGTGAAAAGGERFDLAPSLASLPPLPRNEEIKDRNPVVDPEAAARRS